MSKLVLVDAISTFHVRYIVEVGDDKVDQALGEVKLGEVYDEFYQKHLGETIISQRVVTADEYLELFDKDNVHGAYLSTEQKMMYVQCADQ